MQIFLLNTPSLNNVLNKVLTGNVEFSIRLKDDTNLLTPIIMLSNGTPLTEFNYAYLPEFNRYYYITDIVLESDFIYNIYLKVDVLMSWAHFISKAKGDVLKSSAGNKYLDDGNFLQEVKGENETFYSDVVLPPMGETMLLSTYGKG